MTCSVVVGYQRFGGIFCHRLQGEWNLHGLPKHWYRTTTLQCVTTQKISTSNFLTYTIIIWRKWSNYFLASMYPSLYDNNNSYQT
jgi:hypothetical protein